MFIAKTNQEVLGMAYSMEFRIAVAKAYDECESSIDVAEMFRCSESWVRRLIQRRRLTDSLEPLPPRRPDVRKLREPELEQLRELIERKPDMTLAELAAALGPKGGQPSVPTVWRATRKLGLTLKKSPRTRQSKTGRMSNKSETNGSSSLVG
jgi:transposase